MSYGARRFYGRGWGPRALANLTEYMSSEGPIHNIDQLRNTRKRTEFEKEQLRYFDVIDFKEDNING